MVLKTTSKDVCGYKITSNVNQHFKSGAAPLYHSLVTSLLFLEIRDSCISYIMMVGVDILCKDLVFDQN